MKTLELEMEKSLEFLGTPVKSRIKLKLAKYGKHVKVLFYEHNDDAYNVNKQLRQEGCKDLQRAKFLMEQRGFKVV